MSETPLFTLDKLISLLEHMAHLAPDPEETILRQAIIALRKYKDLETSL